MVTAALVAGFGLAACGGDDDDGADLGSNGAEAGDDLAARGEEVFNSNPCTACHSVDGGSSVGPDLSGIYGTTVELENGETVEVDDAYLRESITDPQAKKVAGYPTAMPEVDLSDDEVDALVAYIRSLG